MRNSDDTVSILTTDVDPVGEDGSPAATSRTYGVAAQQIFDNQVGLLPTVSYNAELVVQLSPEMQAGLGAIARRLAARRLTAAASSRHR